MSRLEERHRMVESQLRARGITDERVLEAFRTVPREAFVPGDLEEFAYRDSPLPIGYGQTISQPYIVAVTLQALNLQPRDRVLEVGTGSGYSAALLSHIVAEVYTVERVPALCQMARDRLAQLGYHNVHVLSGDGSLGWPEHSPYDAIAVAAGGPKVPETLIRQLGPGGRLVIPVGTMPHTQVLTRITKLDGRVEEERLVPVSFVPLIGTEAWSSQESRHGSRPHMRRRGVAALVHEVAEPLETPSFTDSLLERIGDARVVLLGESTHGTSEFYTLRAQISRALIERAGFDFVAVEADWPDAARIDAYVLGDEPRSTGTFIPFSRFPTWMWRNQETHAFVEWLRQHNLARAERRLRVGFHGLDLYSLFRSIAAVLEYLDQVDPEAAKIARARYGLLTPWQRDPAAYGHAVLAGRYESSEGEVVGMLQDLLARRLDYTQHDGERFFDAAQNARVVANAERYYRAMYYSSEVSWNLRDTHMFDTLQALLSLYGDHSRGIVWAHNSHIGDARATEMSTKGELNVGQLCRTTLGKGVYLVGFGTDHGTVAAAPNWGAPMEAMEIRPSLEGSYERIFHDSQVPAFTLALRYPRRRVLMDELRESRLERAIGVVYRPESERASHYLFASLARQFDEYVWFDETRAVQPLEPLTSPARDLPSTYPFGL